MYAINEIDLSSNKALKEYLEDGGKSSIRAILSRANSNYPNLQVQLRMAGILNYSITRMKGDRIYSLSSKRLKNAINTMMQYDFPVPKISSVLGVPEVTIYSACDKSLSDIRERRSEERREIVLGMLEGGLSVTKIAEEMEISRNAVYSCLHPGDLDRFNRQKEESIRKRNAQIASLRVQGLTFDEISDIVGLSASRVAETYRNQPYATRRVRQEFLIDENQ